MSTLAEQLELACLLEATARKPGNVHPGAAFDDLCYDDFVRAAAVSAPILARTQELGIGRAVFEAVNATRAATGTNVNLGICLLLAPLAAGAATGSLWNGARAALAASTVEDTEYVYRAIRLAQPGGMGTSAEQDVSQPPTLTIPEVMALAADRDGIARELSTGFRELEQFVVPYFKSVLWGDEYGPLSPVEMPDGVPMPVWEQAIILTHVKLICFGDTLIRRKCGDTVSREAADQANGIIELNFQADYQLVRELAEFDAWLRADGHRRNPGTSADLIAAAVFAMLATSTSALPDKHELLSHSAAIRGTMRS